MSRAIAWTRSPPRTGLCSSGALPSSPARSPRRRGDFRARPARSERRMKSSVSRARGKLLRFALSLPEAYEDFPWGERVAKVAKKVFVFFGNDGRGADLGLSVKLPAS